jgi:hypothetical protein
LKTLLVIRNQNNHYLGRHGEWLDGSHAPALFRTEHRDVALNELFETNIRDFALRGEILACEADRHGYPVVEVLNPIAAPPVPEGEAVPPPPATT